MGENFVSLLRAAATEAGRAETAFRRSYADRLRELERERVFAHRRAALVDSLARAVSGAEEAEAALVAAERVLAAEIGLSRGNDGHRVVLDRFRPVSEAIDEALNCEGEPDHGAVLDRLAQFEAWYLERTGTPFFALQDVYVQDTPVVDF